MRLHHQKHIRHRSTASRDRPFAWQYCALFAVRSTMPMRSTLLLWLFAILMGQLERVFKNVGLLKLRSLLCLESVGMYSLRVGGREILYKAMQIPGRVFGSNCQLTYSTIILASKEIFSSVPASCQLMGNASLAPPAYPTVEWARSCTSSPWVRCGLSQLFLQFGHLALMESCTTGKSLENSHLILNLPETELSCPHDE